MQTKLQFNCDNCNDSDKKIRGCFTESRIPVMAFGIKGHTKRCPVIDWHEANEYLRVYQYWQKGMYPNKGTWADQPNKLVEAMEAIDGIVSEST